MNDKKETQDKSAALFMPISDLMIDAYGGIEKRSNNTVNISGITTGFDCLDQLIDGFHRGELIVIGGRPSIGKTALAINLAFYAATSEQSHAIAIPIAIALFSNEYQPQRNSFTHAEFGFPC